MSVLFNCLEATRLISKGQHQKLSTYQQLSLNFHLSMCKYCKSFQKDLDYVKDQLAQIDEEKVFHLNENFKTDLKKKILEEISK